MRAICFWLFSFLISTTAHPQPTAAAAPNGPGALGVWDAPDKDGYGTTLKQNLWFTLQNGALSEVTFPHVERQQSNGTFLKIELANKQLLDERHDFNHVVLRIPGSLAYEVTSTSKNTPLKITIHKKIIPNPASSALILEYEIKWQNVADSFTEKNFAPQTLHLIHNPASEGTAGGDGIWVQTDSLKEPLLVAQQVDIRGDEPEAIKPFGRQWLQWNLKNSTAFVGFEGVNGPQEQLTGKSNPTVYYQSALYGNVMGALSWNFPTPAQRRSANSVGSGYSSQKFKALLSFATYLPSTKTKIGFLKLPPASAGLLAQPTNTLIKKQQQEWQDYLQPLNFDHNDPLAEASILLLKASEDKINAGAFIAGPANPSLPLRAQALEMDYEKSRLRQGDSNAGYRRVWPRDLFHMALALISVEDFASAVRILKWLKKVQIKSAPHKIGTWWQNMWTDGAPSWGAFQADQTAFPILLVQRLVHLQKINYADYREMVLSAANALLANGPGTDQERWEENGGLSPNTLAVITQALHAAAKLEAPLDETTSLKYARTAEFYQQNFKKWALITEGTLGNNYFARMEVGQNGQWNPQKHSLIKIQNKAAGMTEYFAEDQILDGGFWQWIMGGLVDPNDVDFSHTLKLVDVVLTRPYKNTQGYVRYNQDSYGLNYVAGIWPLLSAERALVAIERHEDFRPHLETLKTSANKAQMLPEQDTLSVRPLMWSHAAYLILQKSIAEQQSFYKSP